jgi:hypothetical protein
MHQFLHHYLPSSFLNCWSTNAVRRDGQEGPALRKEEDIYVPLCHLTSTERHILIIFQKHGMNFLKIISNPFQIKKSFTKSSKKLFLDRLDPDLKCNSLLCPFCHLSNPN